MRAAVLLGRLVMASVWLLVLAGCLAVFLLLAPFSLAQHSMGRPGQAGTLKVGQRYPWVNLSWTASTSSGVTEYRVYRGTTVGTYTKIGATALLAYQDTTAPPHTTVYYVVTAWDGANESAYSDPPLRVDVP